MDPIISAVSASSDKKTKELQQPGLVSMSSHCFLLIDAYSDKTTPSAHMPSRVCFCSRRTRTLGHKSFSTGIQTRLSNHQSFAVRIRLLDLCGTSLMRMAKPLQ